MARSGREEGLPYSLSRWTDIPGSQNKWDWFRGVLAQGEMIGFDPRDATPDFWSLKPEDTFGLNFWTKDPTNLLKDRDLLRPYKVKVHLTITGWEEVEKGAPSLRDACNLLTRTTIAYGAENVAWRFSPVPFVDDVVDRFGRICAKACRAGIREVYLAFLQENDLMPERRTPAEREAILRRLGDRAAVFGIRVLLCNDDQGLLRGGVLHHNVAHGVCAGPADWDGLPPSEGCGCAIMIDPFTVNESCTFGCQYCLDPSTPVLYSDMVWRSIGAAKVGDALVGFDEFRTGQGRGARKMRETIIEAVSISKQPTIRLITNQSEVVTTANHGWINDRGKWTSTRALWAHGPQHTKLRQIGQIPDLPFTEPFKLGYLAGMTQGDGTFRYEPGQRSNRLGFPQAYWRVALKDEEPLGRLVAYLASFGIESNIRPFDAGPRTHTEMQKVEIRALGKLQRIFELLAMAPDQPDYWRGFLSGFYDAEGSMGGSLRVSQKDRSVLQQAGNYAQRFGFDLYVESASEARNVGSSRLRGPLRDRMRFISTIRPALARKSPDWLGVSFESDDDPVVHKEHGPARDVVDIQTSTHTFFAAGLATHNCYAADKHLSPKKTNTTRSLPIVP